MDNNAHVSAERIPHKTLTKDELHETAFERIHLIAEEFANGFKFLENYPKSVTIFGGSHFNDTNEYYKKALSLGARVVKDLQYSVVTGGGPGIMEAANRGAFEAGGPSLGLTIELSRKQVQNQYLNKKVDFYYFFSRKVCLAFSAEAYIFFPGGLGTLDEFFEIVTLIQTNKIEPVPIILFGTEFWNPLHELMKKELLSRGTIEPDDLKLYTITDNEEHVLDIIRNAPIKNGVDFEYKEPEIDQF